ncbi:hypothetical protein ULMA_28470 [Patiriisocius marinus]|uniref:Uncharacterized protein n=1 Tax=Patiriisocius marinus TaxID=1397112 RepID=A0A5J4IS39_9FLAO|nr:hypothetical protein [Patiriisocius marinus]GER60739.1 hypothetical protein ULMA_28470 [Patiriisocius marinus]
MKQFLFFSILFLLSLFSVTAQTNLSDYSFVVVPDNFEFTSEKDQFQLNSMTKQYLNSVGFNAFFQDELPRVNNCDGLYADVISGGSFITTTMQVILKDCKGTVVFESQEGKSKRKDYRQAYQESLREAFKSINKLNVKQTDIVIDTSPSNVLKATEKRLNDKVAPVIKDKVIVSKGSVYSGPESKFSHYTNTRLSFLLRKYFDSYYLYREDSDIDMTFTLLGELKKRPDGKGYKIEGVLNGLATFQENGDLSIQNGTEVSVFVFQN